MVTVLVAVLFSLAGPATVAAADPIVPPGANDTVRSLAEANARAEAANEAALGAQEQVGVRRAEADRTRREAADATRAATAANARREQAFVAVDRLTGAAFQGGQLDSLSALLGSESPRSYLDRIALLDTLSTENQAVLGQFLDASAAAEGARAAADTRATEARRASDDARRTATDAAARKARADRDVAAADAAYRRAGSSDRAALRAGGITDFPSNVPGSGIAVEALRVALTQQGKPYVWGATGPGTYDCSGLVLWAYRQVGVGLPRVSAAQAQVGTPIAPQDARPGDLMFFNDPVSHVGIYVGDGRFLNAPQSGDVVKVAPVQRGLTGIRRVTL